ncbi:putative late blight resistance protein homolog R1B-16 isoform X1 [Sesamum indicum]|uniref:Late blight resistance protein homolog R1B-16 isoform X1 n=1 Tax=Sesamum indicum TaxID=4182 RepID=A0A6I9SPS1_SESIN|nr:putative late blight resistance protein homolog R1B-16 isoform X1 [Sesamum indicum]
MAHSALVSLMNTLELILHSDRFHFFRAKHYIISIYRKVRFLQTLFEDSPQKSSQEEVDSLEIRIRDSASVIEDLVEFYVSEQVYEDSDRFIAWLDSPTDLENWEYQELDEVLVEIDSLVEELLNDRCGLKDLLPRQHLPVLGSSRDARVGKNVMVGFDEDVMELKHRLTGWESKLQVIPITGMGGVGKTTLARNLYDDSLVKDHFDLCAWVTISQTYLVDDVIRGLLANFGVVINRPKEKSVQDLTQTLWKFLKGRRYIIVLDDMWSTQVWDDMKRMFPDDGNGSRIMLTTRLQGVAVYATDSFSPPHRIRLLDKDKSWHLLCQEVFGQEGCPPEFQELEDIGKMIAHNCKGLPLAARVVGGLLANSAMTREFWGYVADNVNSITIENDEQCSEILSLSYNHLPHHLKPCFLYLGAFPEDYEIPVTKLIRLWIAEGFLRPSRSKSLEVAAEGYLNDLIDRNLVIVRQRGSNGKTRTCTMHDLLRDLCLKEAQNENFLHIINRSAQFSPPDMDNIPRRLIMHLDIPEGNDITECMESMTLTRSVLCTGRVLSTVPFYQSFRFLRVLDFLETEFSEFPFAFLFLVNLRYLAFTFQSFPVLPSKISLLWKLQILIIKDQQNLLNREYFPYFQSYCEVDTPSEVFQMAQLRHVQMTEIFLPNPIDKENPVVLKDLETLCTVANFRCTEEVLRKFPNLKKLGVYYYGAGIEDWSAYDLKNLVRLSKLENLKCVFNWPPNETLLPNLSFPQSLKKLTLDGSNLSWKGMSIIGSLPHLEVLKLKQYAFTGAVWKPVEREFSRLKFLLIEKMRLVRWIAENTHFPCLEHLIISACHDLQAIPSGIGDIPTLKMIDIDDCSSSAVTSVEQILEEQRDMENNVLQVRVRRI